MSQTVRVISGDRDGRECSASMRNRLIGRADGEFPMAPDMRASVRTLARVPRVLTRETAFYFVSDRNHGGFKVLAACALRSLAAVSMSRNFAFQLAWTNCVPPIGSCTRNVSETPTLFCLTDNASSSHFTWVRPTKTENLGQISSQTQWNSSHQSKMRCYQKVPLISIFRMYSWNKL